LAPKVPKCAETVLRFRIRASRVFKPTPAAMTAPPSTITDSNDIAAAKSARATTATADFAAFGSWPAAAAVARNRRARKPTLAAALRQAAKAGAKVSGAVLDPSGRVELRFGEQGAGARADVNLFDLEAERLRKQKAGAR
jgi:hypothetical protein